MAPTVENFRSSDEARVGETQANRLALLEFCVVWVLLTLSGTPVFQVGGGPGGKSGLVGVDSFFGDFNFGDATLAGEEGGLTLAGEDCFGSLCELLNENTDPASILGKARDNGGRIEVTSKCSKRLLKA